MKRGFMKMANKDSMMAQAEEKKDLANINNEKDIAKMALADGKSNIAAKKVTIANKNVGRDKTVGAIAKAKIRYPKDTPATDKKLADTEQKLTASDGKTVTTGEKITSSENTIQVLRPSLKKKVDIPGKPRTRNQSSSRDDLSASKEIANSQEERCDGCCHRLSEICSLFCCPPCPSWIAAKLASRIVAKIAFHPPEPTYSFEEDESGDKLKLVLSEKAEWLYFFVNTGILFWDNIDVFYTQTARNNRIACMYVKCSPNARFTILHSHVNAADLGQMSSFYYDLGSRINCNIFSYDYSGYGCSTGKPSEKNLYADIEAAWQFLRTKLKISPEKIILFGQSIGTAATVDLASRNEVGGVILQSALMSAMRVIFPQTTRTWCFDAFPSIDKIPRVTSPVLVIHGTEDKLFNYSHGLAIYERCPRAVEPLWVEGAGHNDVQLYDQYFERLNTFVSHELE